MDPVEKLITDLQAWARAEHGRPALLARKLGVSKQLVSHWITRRRTPTLHDGFAIQAFLKEAIRAKKKRKFCQRKDQGDANRPLSVRANRGFPFPPPSSPSLRWGWGIPTRGQPSARPTAALQEKLAPS